MPPPTGNGKHTTYKNGDFTWGWFMEEVLPTAYIIMVYIIMPTTLVGSKHPQFIILWI